jgi:ribosomal subunit interface protein
MPLPVIGGAQMSPVNVEVTARGNVSRRARAEARRKVERLEGFSKGPMLGARVVLIQEPNLRIALPARAEAEINLQGRLIHARAAAPSMEAAVDDVAERLQRQLRRYVDRLVTFEHEPASPPPGEWSHHAWTPPRPPVFVRPVEERQLIRHKSFAFDPPATVMARRDRSMCDCVPVLGRRFRVISGLRHRGQRPVDAHTGAMWVELREPGQRTWLSPMLLGTEQEAKGRLWAPMSLLDDPSPLSMAIVPPCSIGAAYGLGFRRRLRRGPVPSCWVLVRSKPLGAPGVTAEVCARELVNDQAMGCVGMRLVRHGRSTDGSRE